MKIATPSYTVATLLLLLQITSCVSFAFQPSARYSAIQQYNHRYTISRSSSSKLYSTIVDEIPSNATLDDDSNSSTSSSSSFYSGDPEEILQSRNKLLALALTLTNNTPSGKIFINRPSDKIKLQNAINNLEGLVGSSSSEINEKSLLGDWKLICTANLPTSDIRRRFDSNTSSDDSKKKKKRRSPLSSFNSKSNKSKLSPLQTSIQNSIQVTQRIRNDGTTGGSGISGEYNINRVDNVIEITPLNTLESVLLPNESSPLQNILSNININPLQVKKSKIVLVHRASIESVKPILRTRIALSSTILNVAGSSSFLEPNGSDILGINNILGEWLQQGTFDTPYVDEDVRISRSSGPIFETLRVFVKQGSTLLQDESQLFDNLSAELQLEKSKSIDDRTSDTEKQVQKVVNAAEDVQKSVSNMASNARSTIEKDLDTVTSALGDSMDEVVSKVQDVVEEDLEVIFKAADDTLMAMQDQDTNEVVEALGNVTKAVAKGASDVREIVSQDVEELGDKVVKATDALVADVQDSVEANLEAVGKSIEGVRDAVGIESDSVDKEEEEEEGDEEGDDDETEESKDE